MDASYDPPFPIRAKGNIHIRVDITRDILPSRANLTNINNVYSFMDKSTALQWNQEEDDIKYDIGDMKAMDYDFYDKETGGKLYCVITRQDETLPSSRNYKWIMHKTLYGEAFLETTNLVSPPTAASNKYMMSLLDVKAMVDKKATNDLSSILHKISLKSIKIYTKQMDTKKWQEKRWTLTEQKFREYCQNNRNWTSLIILMSYNNTENDYEYLSIIKTDPAGCDIGVSYKYDERTDAIFITGFHIDKEAVMEQHILAMPSDHRMQCNCLDSWSDNQNITHLTIGAPNQHHIDKERLRDEVERTKEAMNLMISVSNSMIHNMSSMPLAPTRSTSITSASSLVTNNSMLHSISNAYTPPAASYTFGNNAPQLSSMYPNQQYFLPSNGIPFNPAQGNNNDFNGYNNYNNGFNDHLNHDDDW